MSENEVSSPEEIDQGNPGDVGKYFRYHSDDEEKTLERVFIFHCYFLKATVKSHLFQVARGATPYQGYYFCPNCHKEKFHQPHYPVM